MRGPAVTPTGACFIDPTAQHGRTRSPGLSGRRSTAAGQARRRGVPHSAHPGVLRPLGDLRTIGVDMRQTKELLRYGIVGAFNAAFYLALYTVLVLVGVPYVGAAIV